jgi:hypothetical protein
MLSWFPSKVLMPTASPVDCIRARNLDLLAALSHPIPNSPTSFLPPTEHAKLLPVATLFYHNLVPTPNVPPGFAPLPAPKEPKPILRVPEVSHPCPAPIEPEPVPRMFFSLCHRSEIALIWLEIIAKIDEMSGFVSSRVAVGE